MTSDAPATPTDPGKPWPSRVSAVLRGFGGFGSALVSVPAGLLGLLGVVIGAILPPHGIGPSYCGMQRSLGLPCPGCGLTRSVACFFHGEFAYSFHYHPLGWVFAVIFALAALTLILPRRWRQSAADYLSRHENRVGLLFLLFCIGLLTYGVFRIAMVHFGNPDFAWWQDSGRHLPPFVHDH